MRVEPAGFVVPVDENVSLLEAAQKARVALPSSCRNGTCRACMCRLIEGDVRYRIEWPGLTAEEKAERWVLPCVALATSDVVIEQPEAREIVPSPRPSRSRGF
ncbi:2Fe-2S iron-sulfur cluster binding domain-containing protein [Caballeronia sp. GAWG2-1]|uniref:2Fe-2S iron-sulfur cluster-binding protein n=1 Tax=Caballeronia sp. GAWG2-1 TaxID=2921744 RepID=UPI002028597C|nr:2Fe-2S iron-sulfur cluster binding domain-containing protein [Caballeronia sp. GAWG2-1]